MSASFVAAGVWSPPAGADVLTSTFITPGTYYVTIPNFTTSLNVVANGAAGSAGDGNTGLQASGGKGGHGDLVNVTLPVAAGSVYAPGDLVKVVVGSVGGGGVGGSGDGAGGHGGNGGGVTEVSNLTSNRSVAAAAGGGGGGGNGGAFFTLNGGDGGNGGGVGKTASLGGTGGDSGVSGCLIANPGTDGGTAAHGSDGGGGGGGGAGRCGGQGGSAGPAGKGGGGGGGGAGLSTYDGNGIGTFGVNSFTTASVVLHFTRTPFAPRITSAPTFSVPYPAGTIQYRVVATAFPAPTFSLRDAPPWLSIDPTSGAITGTPPTGLIGTVAFHVLADNGTAPAADQAFTLSITTAPLVLKPPGTLTGWVTRSFAVRLGASGGVAPYTWTLEGALPAGLTLTPAGLISGVPTTAGSGSVVLRATDSALPQHATQSEVVNYVINPRTLMVTTRSLPTATPGKAYTAQLASIMGIAPVTWSVTGTLPAGLSLNPATGVISGTPTQIGTARFSVTASDATTPTPMTATAALSIVVQPVVQAAVYVTNGGNSAVHSYPLTATGNAAPVTTISGPATQLNGTSAVTIAPTGTLYVASSNSQSIVEFAYNANGATAVPTGVISGPDTGLATPAATTLDAAGRLWVANYAATSITEYASGANGDAVPLRTITGPDTGLAGPSALAFDAAGHLWVANYAADSLTEYSATASGNALPMATVTGDQTGIMSPQGLVYDAAANLLLVSDTFANRISGFAPTANGNVTPTRSISGAATLLSWPLALDVDAVGNIYVANELGGVTKYAAAATGNATPIGVISGTATGLKSPMGLAVAPPLSVATTRLQAARAGHRYRTRLHAYLGTTPYVWKIVRGHLPGGLTLTAGGLLSGRPNHAGTYRFTVRVADASHPRMTASQGLTLRVRPH